MLHHFVSFLYSPITFELSDFTVIFSQISGAHSVRQEETISVLPFLSLSHSVPLSPTFLILCIYSSLIPSLSLTFSHNHSVFLSLCLTLTHSLSLSHTHTCTRFAPISPSLSLSHTHLPIADQPNP